jgi:8-oxo-dGTP pyrophosphatase MutT (NUDIX family)
LKPLTPKRDNKMPDWKKLSSRSVYKNKWMEVTEDSVINPAGEKTVYGYYKLANDFLYVVPVDSGGNTYLIEQFRYPVGEKTWEFTAGQTDGEPAEVAARRELIEETGLTAENITKLGNIFADTGISDGRGTVHLATGVKKVTDKLDPVDGITTVKKLPLHEVGEMIRAGKINCPHTISAYFLATQYLNG